MAFAPLPPALLSPAVLPVSGRPARDRLEEILARLAARSEYERVFLHVSADSARAAADESDARHRAGMERGPLDGRIVSLKDIFAVAGERITAGSAKRRAVPPEMTDSGVVQRLKAAGAVIVGRTNLTEFCFTAHGLNRHFGTPGNAADPTRIPGGSSSGAAVSVGEGTSEIAIGSDTGGSVRIPAALNGVVGFKPSHDRISLDGVFPLSPSLDTVGPLARSVADCALADAIMTGAPPVPLAAAALAGIRVGVPRGYLFTDIEKAVAEGFERSLVALKDAGASPVEVEIDDLLEAMRDITRSASIASVEAAAIHADWLTEDTSEVDPEISGVLTRRLTVPAWRYLRMMRERDLLCRAMRQRLGGVDMLALPTVPMQAPELAPLLASAALADEVDTRLLRNPQVVNQFDLTAISLPMPDMALPAGLMLVARKNEDRRLLSLAAGVEEIFS